MQEDTRNNILKINISLISGMIALLMTFVAGVAWGVRLEYKTQENEKLLVTHSNEISAIRSESYSLKSNFAVMQNDLTYIKSGIEEIKTSVKK